jgi:hypothetical protein
VTVRDFTRGREPGDRPPPRDNLDDLPAQVNRRSARHKFRY